MLQRQVCAAGGFGCREGGAGHPVTLPTQLLDEPTQGAEDPDFYRQLEYHVGRLRLYGVGDRVIFERSPVDYLAYLLALGDLDRDTADARLTERALEVAQGSIALLDVIVFLPAGDDDRIVPDAEDRDLRGAVNTRLEGILLDDDLRLLTDKCPAVVEARGTAAERLRTVQGALR